VIVSLAASVVFAEPPSNYHFSQPIHHQHHQQPQQYNHQEVQQIINPTSNVELVPSRERYLVQRAVVQPQLQQAKPAVRQSYQKKASNQQAKFRRNPQPVEIAPQRQQQVQNNAARFQNQKKPVPQFSAPQKNNVRIVKQVAPVPAKVYREAPSSSYGVPSSYQPPAPIPAPSFNENSQSGGYDSSSQSGGDDEGYSYEPPGTAAGEVDAAGNAFGVEDEFSYEAQDVGENSQDGINIDNNLLELIRDVLVEEENFSLYKPSEGDAQVNQPFPKYGPPEDKPAASGPPKITAVDLDEAVQSIQVAQYLGFPSKSAEGGVAPSGTSVSSENSGGFDGYHYKQRFI
jgi:hypothetical protein